MAGGDDNTYIITGHHGRLLVNSGNNIQLRLKSRPEAEARFRVNDATGCWFSVQLHAMGANNSVQLAAMRDALTNALWFGATPGIIAQVQVAPNGSQAQLSLYTKNPSQTNSFGTTLYAGGWLTLVTNRLLELYVNSTNTLKRF